MHRGACPATDHVADLGAIFPADGEDGASWITTSKTLPFIVEIEQLTGQDQVAGAGNREKFGQSLDYAENQSAFNSINRSMRAFANDNRIKIQPAIVAGCCCGNWRSNDLLHFTRHRHGRRQPAMATGWLQ